MTPLVQDRSPAGCLDASCAAGTPQQIGYVYVDNLCVLGTPAAAVDRAISQLAGAFDAAGLQTHERGLATTSATTL